MTVGDTCVCIKAIVFLAEVRTLELLSMKERKEKRRKHRASAKSGGRKLRGRGKGLGRNADRAQPKVRVGSKLLPVVSGFKLTRCRLLSMIYGRPLSISEC